MSYPNGGGAWAMETVVAVAQDPEHIGGALSLVERYGAFGLLAVVILVGGYIFSKVLKSFLDSLLAKLDDLRTSLDKQAKATETLNEKLVNSTNEQINETRSMRMSLEQLTRLRGGGLTQ